jgi:nicotinamidase-related amidase
MDYQVAVLGILSQPDDLLDRVAHAISLARQRGIHVVYVKVGFEDDDFDAIPERSMMSAMLAPSGRTLRPDSPLTAFAERIAPDSNDTVVRKTRVGAFSTTNLHELLRGRGIDTLILSGITTGNVVLSTVIEAFELDYLTYVLNDACDEPDTDLHEFLMENVFPRKSHVITIHELENLLPEVSSHE